MEISNCCAIDECCIDDGQVQAYVSADVVDEYADLPIDYVITVCDHASERCPV